MAVKKKVVEIDTLQATTSVKELRQQLKALKDQMLSTTEGTEEYNEALTKAAEITHTLKEQTEFINATAMDFGLVVSNVNGALGGMVGGLQAAKAAMNLFGVENEDVLKSLQKMQSLMAITQALPSIDKGIKAFQKLGIAIKAAAAGMNTLKKALISSGIGVLITGIGLLIANWDKLTAVMNKSETAAKTALENIKTTALGASNALKGILGDISKMNDKMVESLRELAWLDLLNAMKLEEIGVSSTELIEMLNRYFRALKNGNAELARDTKQTIDTLLQGHDNVKVAFENFMKTSLTLHDREVEANNLISDAYKERQKQLEDLTKAYNDVISEIQDYNKTQEELDLAKVDKEEQKRLKTIKDYLVAGKISKEQAEKDTTAITEHYEKERNEIRDKYRNADIAAEQSRKISRIAYIEQTYELETNKLQAALDDQLISKEQFEERKKQLDEQYKNDYVAILQQLVDDESLSIEQRIDLYEKLNNARAPLTTDNDDKSEAEKISEAINASALALNDFSGNPAWGKILQNIAILAANWKQLHTDIQAGGKKAATAYLQIFATAFSAMSAMFNGLAAEMDTSNKKGFESQKNLQAAGATMSMLGGIVSAWASAMQLGPIAGPIVGALLSAMMLATGIANIIKIKQQKFNSGGSNASGSSATPNASAVASIQAPVQYTQDVQGASIEGAIKDTRVYVTEGDISSTQKRVDVAESEARF